MERESLRRYERKYNSIPKGYGNFKEMESRA